MTEAENKLDLSTQKTPHISPSRVSYGVPFVKILGETDRIITALHCM